MFLFRIGLSKEEKGKYLNDVILMRLAHRVRTENLYPLTAELLDNVKYLEDVKTDFSDLRQAEHAYLVMAEWRKRTRNKRGDTSAGRIVEILKGLGIDQHLVCLVRGSFNALEMHV